MNSPYWGCYHKKMFNCCLRTGLYCDGTMPVSRLNARLNADLELNPAFGAISSIASLFVSFNRTAPVFFDAII